MSQRLAQYMRQNVLAMIAIFLALTGGAYAIGTLPKNSVGTKQLKNGAVTGIKVARKTLTGNNINASTLGTVPSAARAASSDRLGGLGPSAFQLRVSGVCASGAISQVNQNGTVGCAALGGPPSGAAGGDLTGTYPNPNVATVGGHTPITDATPAGGTLSGTYPSPTLNVSGGDSGTTACKNGEALSALSTGAALTCSPGVYSDASFNVAAGPSPFGALTTGSNNVVVGSSALTPDTTGSDNSALGFQALHSNHTGNNNSAVGSTALADNLNGNDNSAVGQGALRDNFSGANNSALGYFALASSNGGSNTALGFQALQANSGNGNSAVGADAGKNLTTGSNNIDIANTGVAADANTIKIGTQGTQTSTLLAGVNGSSITGPTNLALTNGSGLLGTGTTGTVSLPAAVDGATSTTGVSLLINASGVLGTTTSSRRFKTDIRPLGAASGRALMALRPVSFHYKARYIKGQPDALEYGLIAEEVAKINPSLVAYGNDGKPYTVRYQELPALLLAQIQAQQRQISSQRAEINWLMAHARMR